MRRLLTLAVAACICGQAHADPDDFRCFVSIGHQPPIRLEIEFTNANAGYVTYEHGHGRIPVALTDELRHKGPYCQLCYDRDGLLMRLQKQQRHWKCQCCGNVFVDAKMMKETSMRRSFPTAAPRPPIPLFVK